MWRGKGNLLVSVDGGNRLKHVEDWVEYMIKNQDLPILLLIDNSEWDFFASAFKTLLSKNTYIFHCYGNVYGQLTTKQCTSFATFNPILMHGACTAPMAHDQRWGKMNMQ